METIDETSEDWKRRIGVGEPQHSYGRHAGTSRVEPVRREDNGKVGGHYTHHWDGRKDATVHAGPVRILPRVQEGV